MSFSPSLFWNQRGSGGKKIGREKMLGEESWQGGRRGVGGWRLQTHVTNDAGPHWPSVNSMCVSTFVSASVVQDCIVRALGSCGWWPLYVALLSHPFTSHLFACHTHRSAHRHTHTHGAWPAMSLKSQEAQMWQQINVVWPRSTHRSTHTLTHPTLMHESCCTSH